MSSFPSVSNPAIEKSLLDGVPRDPAGLVALAATLLAILVSAPAAVAACPVDDICEPPPVETDSPTAHLTVSPNPAEPGQSVSFHASASTGGSIDGEDQPITRYEWNADGDSSNGYEVDTGTTATLSRSYALAGARSVGVRVRSNAGSDTATKTLTVRPVVAFEHADDLHINGSYIGYYFSAVNSVAGPVGFQCSKNGGGWQACNLGQHPTDPTRSRGFSLFGSMHSPLPEGRYTLDVKAVDPNGVESAVARRSFTVDRTPPANPPTLTGSPVEGAVTKATSASFDFSSTEPGVNFRCGVNTTPTQPCSAQSGHTASGLNEGFYTFRVVAVDRAGNASPAAIRNWEVDRTPPETSILAGPAQGSTTAQTSATFGFSDSGGSRFECRIDGGPFGRCSGPDDAHTVSGLSSGPHTFEVRAVDAAGNADPTPASRTWTVGPGDTTAPNTSITSGPSRTVRSTSASFGFSSSESGSSFRCRRDGGSWERCASPKAYSGLSQDSHTIEVAATDAAGNRDATPAVRSWRIDTVAPRVTGSSPSSQATGVAPTANVSATFSEGVRPSTVTRTTVKLVRKGTTTPVRATLTYDAARKRAKLDPSSALRRGSTYTATVSAGVKDPAGNPLASARTWSFTVRR